MDFRCLLPEIRWQSCLSPDPGTGCPLSTQAKLGLLWWGMLELAIRAKLGPSSSAFSAGAATTSNAPRLHLVLALLRLFLRASASPRQIHSLSGTGLIE